MQANFTPGRDVKLFIQQRPAGIAQPIQIEDQDSNISWQVVNEYLELQGFLCPTNDLAANYLKPKVNWHVCERTAKHNQLLHRLTREYQRAIIRIAEIKHSEPYVSPFYWISMEQN